MIDVILGLQWGDEGKGKIVDYLSDQYDIIARFQGGSNAGHTVVIGDQKYVTHLVPCGVFKGKIGLIGQGVVVDPICLYKEISSLHNNIGEYNIWDLLKISSRAKLILPTHRLLDKASEEAKGDGKIGSTLKGIRPAYEDHTGRRSLFFDDMLKKDFKIMYDQAKADHLQQLSLYSNFEYQTDDLQREEQAFFDALEHLKTLEIVDTGWIHRQLEAGKKILAEGAQGSLLDIDAGTYPYVTSSNTTISGVFSGLGVSHKKIGKVYGVVKAYTTRVGNGPFPTKLTDEDGEYLQKKGHEFGATTGRKRDCGWIDKSLLRAICELNGVDELFVTKLDVLSGLPNVKYSFIYKSTLEHVKGIEKSDMWYPGMESLETVHPLYAELPGWEEDITDIREYNNLPESCKSYVYNAFLGLPPIKAITNGPERESIILMG